MKIKIFSILAVVVLLVGQAPLPVSAAPKPVDYSPVDVGPEIRGWEATADRVEPTSQENLAADAAAAQAAVDASTTDCVTDTKYFMILNDYLGKYQIVTFYLMGEGPLSQVWVQANLAFPTGDPRATPEITCDQVQYMVGQFEGNMYPKETSFFGTPDTHDGSAASLPGMLGLPDDYYFDAAGRQVILVSNVRDENYYDSTYPIYIAGFFSPAFEDFFDRNAMTIDAYDWVNRTGPSSTKPYLYEGVFAHEYQHLLHADYDPGEELFINEGMSDFAEYLVGYGAAMKGHLDAAAANPENSLTVWGDQGDLEILTDYGQAALFQMYLMEQFGEGFIQALFKNPDHGIAGINSTLAAFNSHRDFSDIFHDWSVAMLIDSKTVLDGMGFAKDRYQFKNLDFKLNIGTPSAPNPEAFDTPGAPPWGTDYLWLQGDPKKFAKLTFNGLDYSTFPTKWSSDGSVLWGGQGDLVDNWAIFPTKGGGTLTFDTKYDIEQYWDFAFVQVSTDGGYTWTSLANASTTDLHDPSAYPTIVANLPGLTGTQADWVNMSFDLSAYAGQDILIAFRYLTDWSTSQAGWFIDNVAVDGSLISDGSDASVFKDITEIVPINNDFSVTLVGQKKIGKTTFYQVKAMHLNHVTEDGRMQWNNILRWCDSVAMLVTYKAQDGITFYADYNYELTYRHSKPKSRKPIHGGYGFGTHFGPRQFTPPHGH
jgi:immune inhibitor A